MDETNASLSNLRDIVLPDAPGLWPLAPGLCVLLAFFVLLVVTLAWLIWRLRTRNAYRRAGLLLLKQSGTCYEVSVVLKRVALAAFPRTEVAPLHGAAWTDFLNRQSDKPFFNASAFDSGDAPADHELKECAALWIRRHRI